MSESEAVSISDDNPIENTDQIETEDKPVEKVADTNHNPKHMTMEEWIDKGNSPDDYKTPEQFEEAGKWIGITKSLRREMDEMKISMAQAHEDQIQGLNKLHTQQLEAQVKSLTAKRDAAINDLDRDGANAAQAEIDRAYADQQPVQKPQQQQKDPAIVAWERENPWIMEQGEKTDFANARMNTYLQSNYSISDALAALSGDISRTYPATNANRKAPANSESGSKPGAKREARNLTMADLTAAESSQYVKSMWKDEKQFLDAVKNSRKG
jgi:hypothetical protein